MGSDRAHKLYCCKMGLGLSPFPLPSRDLDLLGPSAHGGVRETNLWVCRVMNFGTVDLRGQVVVPRHCEPDCQVPTVRAHFYALLLLEL